MSRLNQLIVAIDTKIQSISSEYGGSGILKIVSGRPNWTITDQEDFEELRDHVSITYPTSEDSLPSWPSVYGFPVAFFLLGLVVSISVGSGLRFLTDPVPYVFSTVAFISLKTWFLLDARLFTVIEDIKRAFRTTDPHQKEYYRLFGELVERLYEPFPFAAHPDESWIHWPTFLLTLCGSSYLIFLYISGLGNTPSQWPEAMQWHFILLSIVGIYVISLMVWIVVVMAVFMTFEIQELEMNIVLTRRQNNLGLESYSSLIVTIAVRMFLALAVGGFALVTVPSPFILSVFLLGSLLIIAWFVGTQYGLHRLIVTGKQQFVELLEQSHPAIRDSEAVLNDKTSREEIESAILKMEQINELPDWPVTVQGVIKFVGSFFISAFSLLKFIVVSGVETVL